MGGAPVSLLPSRWQDEKMPAPKLEYSFMTGVKLPDHLGSTNMGKGPDDAMYTGDPKKPRCGDLRVSFLAAKATVASAVAATAPVNMLTPWTASSGRKVGLIAPGSVSAADMLDSSKGASASFLWMIRAALAGLALFGMILVVSSAECLPCGKGYELAMGCCAVVVLAALWVAVSAGAGYAAAHTGLWFLVVLGVVACGLAGCGVYLQSDEDTEDPDVQDDSACGEWFFLVAGLLAACVLGGVIAGLMESGL
mmetsp:Transcript_75050/g.172012  ORF Transcript_75050/g.172012 Transcript_75050/m.172012 type:complete len:252 (+) Transcript_75050:534-1289(+)